MSEVITTKFYLHQIYWISTGTVIAKLFIDGASSMKLLIHARRNAHDDGKTMEIDKYFGVLTIPNFVRKWMEVNEYSQMGLAQTMGVSKSMVNFIARGEPDIIPLPFIKRFYPLLNEREREVIRTILYHLVTKDLE